MLMTERTVHGAAAGLTTSFRVGRYRCEMSIRDGRLVAEWTPDIPTHGSFGPKEMAEYRRGRDAFMAELAQLIGGGVLVIE
jgi:hypothetical protein